MSVYATKHAAALAKVRAKGAAVTFTRTVQAHTESTDDVNPSTSSVAGYAMRVPGSPKTYADLSLKSAEAVTLFFVGTTFGEKPALGSVVTWNAVKYRVRSVDPFEPDGSAIYSNVVAAKG